MNRSRSRRHRAVRFDKTFEEDRAVWCYCADLDGHAIQRGRFGVDERPVLVRKFRPRPCDGLVTVLMRLLLKGLLFSFPLHQSPALFTEVLAEMVVQIGDRGENGAATLAGVLLLRFHPGVAERLALAF